MESKIRTLGLYQPFITMMGHGKIETRWLIKGKKPPFPLGEYMLYSTKNAFSVKELQEMCTQDQINQMGLIKARDIKAHHFGHAGYFAKLVDVRLMVKSDEARAFVKFVGERQAYNFRSNKKYTQTQWCLEFTDVVAIPESFPFTGKQGVGLLDIGSYGHIYEKVVHGEG